jgi:DNA polymerase III delta prime subunit
MKILKETFENTGDIHHAYLLEGEKELIREKLLDFVEKNLKHPTQGNPDFWHETFETFSIDDARKLRDMQSVKPLVHPRKIFIIEVLGMTVEAQNALLKIFEEPTPGTHFFLIADSADLFLPTLRSRMTIIFDEERSGSGKTLAKKFLSATQPERLKMIDEIVEEKDKAMAQILVDSIIVELQGQPSQGFGEPKKDRAEASYLRELLMLRGYLADRSPSIKLILEHISLILPII